MKKRVSYVFCSSYSKSCQETESVFFFFEGKEIEAKKEPEEQSSS